MSEEKFDEAAFEAAISKPTAWDEVQDPVSEVRKMRGDDPQGNETVGGILAGARSRADYLMSGRGGYPFTPLQVKLLCDRIEAAAERLVREERTEAIDEALAHAEEVRQAKCRNCKRAPQGNAAATREALNQLRDWALLDINENAIRSDEPNYKKLVDGIVEITNAALNAPPRNCDRYADKEEAQRKFLAQTHDIVFEATMRNAFEWMFATGGGHNEE
jgi:hypothetical protein